MCSKPNGGRNITVNIFIYCDILFILILYKLIWSLLDSSDESDESDYDDDGADNSNSNGNGGSAMSISSLIN
jgi:hypothetical protein